MLYSTNPLVVQFVQDLQHFISSLQALSTQQVFDYIHFIYFCSIFGTLFRVLLDHTL